MWRNLLKANLIYAFGNVANSAALFLLVPYLVNAFPPQEYGAWSIFEIAILFLNMLILTGLDIGLMREYWFLDNDNVRSQLAGNVLLAISLWGGILFVCGTVLLTIGVKSSLPGAPQTLVLVLATAWMEAVFAFFLTLFRVREQPAIFVALSVSRMALFMGMAIGLVEAGYGLPGALIGRLGGTILTLGVAIGLGYRYISARFDWTALKRVLRYGLPLLPTNIASYILFASDRYVLQHFSTLENVAIYTFAYKIATMLDILITRPFAVDWAPRRFKIATYDNAHQKYAQVLLFYLWTAITFTLLVIALTPTIYIWLSPPIYRTGMSVVPVILLAYLIYGLSYPLNVGIMLKDRTKHLPIIGWIAAAVCLGLNFWWIPRYGILGAAWATVVAYSFWTAGITWVSIKLYPVRYSLQQVGWILVAGLVGYTGIWFSDKMIPLNDAILMGGLRAGWTLIAMGATGLMLWRNNQVEYQ